MNLELINQIFEVCIIPLLAVLTTFIIKFIQTKQEEIINNIDNQTTEKYIELLSQTIVDCVIATNQTYVNSLKEQGKFDAEAQKIALEKTCNAVLSILSDDAKTYLSNIFGDLETYILQKIESAVSQERLVIDQEGNA